MVATKQVSLSEVSSVYSGKPGCCCGCRGKHTYTQTHRQAASKSRGYEVTDDEVNDGVVKQIVGKINKLLAEGLIPEVDDTYLAVELPNRLYVVYFKQ